MHKCTVAFLFIASRLPQAGNTQGIFKTINTSCTVQVEKLQYISRDFLKVTQAPLRKKTLPAFTATVISFIINTELQLEEKKKRRRRKMTTESSSE